MAADRSRQYQEALDLYTETLERFILVFNRESNPLLKQAMHSTISAYMERAEKIKNACQLLPRRVPDSAVAQTPPQASSQGNSRPVSMAPSSLSQSNVSRAPQRQQSVGSFSQGGSMPNVQAERPQDHRPPLQRPNSGAQSSGSLLEDSGPSPSPSFQERPQASYEGSKSPFSTRSLTQTA